MLRQSPPGEYGAQVLRFALVNQLDCCRKAVWLCTADKRLTISFDFALLGAHL